jgi:cation transport ATPase
MDTLVSIGIIASTAWSLYLMFATPSVLAPRAGGFSLLQPGQGIYLEVAGGVTTFLLIGRLFEARARRLASGTLRSLAGLAAHEVALLDEAGLEHQVPIARLKVGDRFVVRPGEMVAADGEVVLGQSSLDCARMTGESLPVDVVSGDSVLGEPSPSTVGS